VSTHTPGPWVCGSNCIEAEDGTIIAETVAPMKFHDAKVMTAGPDLLAVAESVKVVAVEDDLYVGLIVEGRGFCSAKITAGFNSLADEWERLRVAAIAKATGAS
jgi:hypothetical protein